MRSTEVNAGERGGRRDAIYVTLAYLIILVVGAVLISGVIWFASLTDTC